MNRLKALRTIIFKDVLPADAFEPSYDRSQCADCRNLRGQTSKGRDTFPPILFPQGIIDFKNLFRSVVLVRVSLSMTILLK